MDIFVCEEDQIAYGKFGFPIKATKLLSELQVGNYDAVFLPGGNIGPEKIRANDQVKEFIRDMNTLNKYIFAICHGPWILISANILSGRRATCYRKIVDDLKNAGAIYEYKPVVIDGNIFTSRHPDDLPLFMSAIIAEIKND